MLRLLEPKTIVVIFANVEDILLTNTTFLSSLEERQRSCRLYIDTIGDILDKHMTNMTTYKARLRPCIKCQLIAKPDLALLYQPSICDQSVAIIEK
jgi:hypothetical protein